jgi:hypothetical protein
LEEDFNTKNFKIEFKALELRNFDEYWKEIWESGERKIDKISNGMFSARINDVYSRRTSNYLLEVDKDYNTIQFKIEFNKSNIKHHKRFQFIKKELMEKGRKEIYPLIRKSLQIQNFNLNSPLYSIILFPLYIKIEDLVYTNNYLSGDVFFHKIYEGSKLHFILESALENSDEHTEFLLSTERDKIKWYRYKDLSDEVFKIRFTVHFEKIVIKQSPAYHKIICRLQSPDFDLFLLDYNILLKEIYKDIKNIEKIPNSILQLIEPLLKINLLDHSRAEKKSEKIIENLINNGIEELKDIILDNIDWLKSEKNLRLLNDFFSSAANRGASHYNNYFANLIVQACDKIIKSQILEDIDVRSKFNDLLIRFNYNLYFRCKVYYYGKRLAEKRGEIKLLMDEIFEKYPQSLENIEYDRKGKVSLDFPKFWCEIKLNIPNSHFICEVHFFRNNSSIFNFHVIHILFYSSLKEKSNWYNMKYEQKEKLIQFLDRLSAIQDLEIIEYNLPSSIDSKLKKKSKTDEISKSELYLKEKKKFKIIGIKGNDEYMFSDLNILIGKNNTGKTLLLTKIFEKLMDFNNRIYDNQEAFNEFQRKYSEFHAYELYYIPNNREIDKPIGKKSDLKEGLIQVITNLMNLMSQDFLKKEPINIENRNNENSSNLWKIPNFLQIIDIFSVDVESTEKLTHEDTELIDYGKSLFKKFNQIWKSWKSQIESFFEEIEINRIQDLGRSGKYKIPFYNKWRKKEISNWKSFGSGTQQLLNLIFLIEFLKICPSIRHKELLEEIKTGNFDTAFDENVKEIHINRIILIDEPDVSLHPSLQRRFFNYLNESSQILQIFVATQSPFFLDINNFKDLLGNTIFVTLCKKDEIGQYSRQKIHNNNKILIIDQLFDYNHLETAFYLSKNNFEDLMITEDNRDFYLLSLEMINDLIYKRREYDPDYSNLLNLGTFDEQYDARLIQNAIFLSLEPNIVNLNENNGINECEKIFLYQLHNNEFKHTHEKMRFKATCASHWDIKTCINSNVLVYTKEESISLTQKISKKLNKIQNEGGELQNNNSIMLFPENTLPYRILDSLIDFAKKNNIIIVGGMEHIKLRKFKDFINQNSQIISNNFIRSYNFDNIDSFPNINDDSYINQAVIINSNGRYSFQIKNIPVAKSGTPIEGIPLIPIPKYFKFKTSVGNVALFICKDFLVNYEVIDKWMDKYEIKILLVPSFTYLVNPFIYKFGNIMRKRKNENKTIAFVNLAEYSGSGIFNPSYERIYEPGNEILFKLHEEDCKEFHSLVHISFHKKG